jgi:glycosyltransferase involved in cell wall biosynthesis
MRVTLVISSLARGGAESVMAMLANGCATEGHDVTLITLASTAADDLPLHGAVARVALDEMSVARGIGDALRANCGRLVKLRRAIRESRGNVVVSFLTTTNVLTLGATANLPVPVIVSERIDPREEPISVHWAQLRRLLYPRAAALVVQTTDLVDWATQFVPAGRVRIIPNAVTLDRDRDLSPAVPPWLSGPGPKLLGVGRLSRQKGFDLLIEAFARCAPRHPEWSLVILGEGPERSSLQRLATELRVEQSVTLPGKWPNAARLMGRADLFVLPSRYEGFPNALLEAMAAGVPVIAADCPSGPRHIVSPDVDGLLVPPSDVSSLSDAMHRLMSDPADRQRLGSQATAVTARFSVERVMREWRDLLVACEGRADGPPHRKRLAAVQ